MVVEGFKFAVGIGIGCVLLLFAAVMVSGVIFRLEGLAYRRGWLEEPHRAMPKRWALWFPLDRVLLRTQAAPRPNR